MKIFVVYDNEKKGFFKSGSKVSWSNKSGAKNAVINKDREACTPEGAPFWATASFSNQTRYEIKEVNLEAYFEMKHRLEALEK